MAAVSNILNQAKVYSEVQGLPHKVKSLVRDYAPECFDPLPNFVNLSDLHVLKGYLQDEGDLPWALKLVKRTYEVRKRAINKTKSGFAFTIEPEVLAYAMERAQGGNVLEIAGASGETAILLALAGAKRVYVNDREPEEMGRFRDLQAQLPNSIQNKLEALEGDCFEVLEKRADFKGKMDLVLCRNLIHFFNDEQQAKLFQLLKTVLKPGGCAILTAQSVYTHTDLKELSKKDPDATSFVYTACIIDDYVQKTHDPIFQQTSVCSGDLMGTPYKNQYLYEKNFANGYKWTVDNNEFSALDASVRPLIKDACKKSHEEMKKIPTGAVRVLTSYQRIYSKQNISKPFEVNGFETVFPFAVNQKGHLIDDAHLLDDGASVGVILKAPSA